MSNRHPSHPFAETTKKSGEIWVYGQFFSIFARSSFQFSPTDFGVAHRALLEHTHSALAENYKHDRKIQKFYRRIVHNPRALACV